MHRAGIAALLAGALLLPVSAADAHKRGHGHAPKGPAAKACQAERAQDAAAFEAKYANSEGKRAQQRCVKARLKAARAACKAERDQNREAFRAQWGRGEKKRHALRRCVRERGGSLPAPAAPPAS